MEGVHPCYAMKKTERRSLIHFNFRLNIEVSDLHQTDEFSSKPRSENKKIQLTNSACGFLSMLEASIYIPKKVIII